MRSAVLPVWLGPECPKRADGQAPTVGSRTVPLAAGPAPPTAAPDASAARTHAPRAAGHIGRRGVSDRSGDGVALAGVHRCGRSAHEALIPQIATGATSAVAGGRMFTRVRFRVFRARS